MAEGENQREEIQELEPPPSESSGDFIDSGKNYYDKNFGEMGEAADEKSMGKFKKLAFQRQEQRLSKKLDRMIRNVPKRIYPYLYTWEKRTVEQAKPHKNLRRKLRDLSIRINIAKMKAYSKLMSTIGPAIPYIVTGGLIIIAIIAVAAMFDYMFGLLNNSGSGDSTAAPMGPKGKDFYAVRAVYSDEEQAEIDQINDYIDILKGTKDQIDADITANALEVKFNLNLPAEKDIELFLQNKNSGDYAVAYEIITEMAEVVYLYDNAGGNETELEKQLLNIKYFGYNGELLNRSGDNNDLTDIIKANLLEHKESLFEPIEEDADLPLDLTDKVDLSVDAFISTVPNLRTEKFYIEDFVLDQEESTMEGIKKANYVAIIMYAREDFSAQYMQFFAGNVKVENFEAYVDNFGEKIEFDIVPEDSNDIYNDPRMPGDNSELELENKQYNYEIDHSFTIGKADEPVYLNTLVEDKNTLNLYDIALAQLTDLANSSLVKIAVDESGNNLENVYTYKLGGYSIITSYNEVFGFSINLEPKRV